MKKSLNIIFTSTKKIWTSGKFCGIITMRNNFNSKRVEVLSLFIGQIIPFFNMLFCYAPLLNLIKMQIPFGGVSKDNHSIKIVSQQSEFAFFSASALVDALFLLFIF